MMGHEVGPYLGLDKTGSLSSIFIFIIIDYFLNRTFLDISVRIFRIYPLGFSFGVYK